MYKHFICKYLLAFSVYISKTILKLSCENKKKLIFIDFNVLFYAPVFQRQMWALLCFVHIRSQIELHAYPGTDFILLLFQ